MVLVGSKLFCLVLINFDWFSLVLTIGSGMALLNYYWFCSVVICFAWLSLVLTWFCLVIIGSARFSFVLLGPICLVLSVLLVYLQKLENVYVFAEHIQINVCRSYSQHLAPAVNRQHGYRRGDS